MEHQMGRHSGPNMKKEHGRTTSPYLRLAAMAAFSFISMFVLMYAMVDRFENVIANLNQFYMAGLMAAPMVFIELILMSGMYPDKRKNLVIGAVSLLALAGFFLLIRQQAAVKDEEFLRSMIPHHAGALLMCGEASIEDPEIRELCRQIEESQQREIDQMKAILERLDN